MTTANLQASLPGPSIVSPKKPRQHLGYLDEIMRLWSLCLLIACSQRRQPLLDRFFGRRFLVFLGGFSYSLYLIHAPLLQILWQYFIGPTHLPVPLRLTLLAVAGMPIIVGLSY